MWKEKNLEESIENWKNRYLIEDSKLKKDILTKTKTAWNDNLEKLKKEIIDEKTQVVSFDIFDTLIMRPFWNPIDLFTFLNKYFSTYRISIKTMRISSYITCKYRYSNFFIW